MIGRETLGTRLRQLRAERGCSLSELSRRSGIGKGTLSELENDHRDVRLGTLLVLTTALEVPLSAVLPDVPGSVTPVVRGDSVTVTLLGQWSTGQFLVDAYRAVMTTEHQHSVPHAPGVFETVTIVRGRARVGCTGTERELREGKSLRYRGDRPHHFAGLGARAEAVLLMHYPCQQSEEGSTHRE